MLPWFFTNMKYGRFSVFTKISASYPWPFLGGGVQKCKSYKIKLLCEQVHHLPK